MDNDKDLDMEGFKEYYQRMETEVQAEFDKMMNSDKMIKQMFESSYDDSTRLLMRKFFNVGFAAGQLFNKKENEHKIIDNHYPR